MKNKVLKSLGPFLPFLVVFVMCSCSKERFDVLKKEDPEAVKVAEKAADELKLKAIAAPPITLFMKWKKKPVKATLKLKPDSTVKCEGGTSLQFMPNTFVDENGRVVQYPVDLEIIELLTPKDMITNQMPTVSDKRLLVTGGEINIKAFKDNQSLTVVPGGYSVIISADSVDTRMSIFYGKESKGIVNWVPSDSSGVPKDSVSQILFRQKAYQMFPRELGWINCDRFYDFQGAKTNVKFVSEFPNISYIYPFMYFDRIKSLAQVYGDISLPVPVGEHVKIVSIAATSELTIFAFIKEYIVEANQVVEIKLTKIEEEELMKLLDKF